MRQILKSIDPQKTKIRKKPLTAKVRKEALHIITQRVEHHAAIMQLSYNTIKVSTARRRRGSCTSTRNLIFNWKLTQFPLFVLDYVVIHELAHLVHFNHSPRFRSLVEKYCPEYKTAKKWLREHERGGSVR